MRTNYIGLFAILFVLTGCTTETTAPGTNNSTRLLDGGAAREPGGGEPGDDPDGDGNDDTGDDTGGDDTGGGDDGGDDTGGGDDGTDPGPGTTPPSTGYTPYGTGRCDDGDVIDLGSAEEVSMTLETSGEADSSVTSDECSPFCNQDMVGDRVLMYTPPRDGTIFIRTDSGDTSVETTTLSIFGECGGSAPVLACDAHTRPYQKRLLYQVREGETIYIGVDGCQAEDEGAIGFSLELLDTMDDGQGGDVCGDATELTFMERDGKMWAQAFGKIDSGTNDDMNGQCGNGAEVFYAFELEQFDGVRVFLEPLDSELDVSMDFVDEACDASVETVCADMGGPGEAETMMTAGSAGVRHIAVDGVGGTEGIFRIVVTIGEND